MQDMILPNWEPLKEILQIVNYHAEVVYPEKTVTQVWLAVSEDNSLLIVKNMYEVPWTYVENPKGIQYDPNKGCLVFNITDEGSLVITLLTKEPEKSKSIYALLDTPYTAYSWHQGKLGYIPHPRELLSVKAIIDKYTDKEKGA